MPSGEPEDAGRPRRIDAGEILDGALNGLDSVPDTLAAELLAGPDDANRVQRIQSAIRSATDG